MPSGIFRKDCASPDKKSHTASPELLQAVDLYINEHYDESAPARPQAWPAIQIHLVVGPYQSGPKPGVGRGLRKDVNIDRMIGEMDEPFSTYLLQLIDEKGMTDADVYKRAQIGRKHFSKIRTGKGYTPKKQTILALAVALELSLAETDELLSRAGYALSHASKFDIIVEYFIINRNYDIDEINSVLLQYDQLLLGDNE